MANKNNNLDTGNLRKKAEALLKTKSDGAILNLSEADILKLIHELEVYKVELELQQGELLLAKDERDDANERYNELFDLHNRLILHMLKKGTTLE